MAIYGLKVVPFNFYELIYLAYGSNFLAQSTVFGGSRIAVVKLRGRTLLKYEI